MTVVFPTARIRSVSRVLARAQGASRSPFTGTSQVQDWGGAWWQYNITCSVIKGRAARELSAFLTALDGMATPFLLHDPSLSLSRPDVGVLHRAPVVDGGAQIGTTLETTGWDQSTCALRAGDFFSLGTDDESRLYQVVADALADAGGNATLNIRPRLRSSPLDGDPLEVTRPAVALRLTRPAPDRIEPADRFTFDLTAEEAL